MYYVAPETPMMSSVIVDCPDLAPPNIFLQVYAYERQIRDHSTSDHSTSDQNK